jgi:hypothetical protein
MFLLWRLVKLFVKLALLLALAFVAFVAWGNFWPKPSHAPTIPCPPRQDGFRCVKLSGRVAFHTSFTLPHRAHLVLLSRSSKTLPGLTFLEFPRISRAPAGVGIGDWITVAGQSVVGSHHEHDVHVWAFATLKVAVRCADPRAAATCRRVPVH